MNLAIKRTLSTSMLAAGALATVLATASTAGAVLPAPRAVTPNAAGCDSGVSDGGHTLSETCWGYHGGANQFRVVVNFCNTSNCALVYGSWAYLGTGISVASSGGYATADSIVTTQYRLKY